MNKINLIQAISSSSNYHIFHNALLKFIRHVERKIFNINDPFGIKLLRLRLGFSHLREYKFRNSFKDTLNALSFCSIDAETTTHYFLLCFYNSNQATLMNDLKNIPICFSTVSDNNLISLVLYGDDKLHDTKNRKNINVNYHIH